MNEIKELREFKDENGFIGHKTGREGELEFGDSAQRTFMLDIFEYFLLVKTGSLSESFINQKISSIYLAFSEEYTRHPDTTKWWGQTGTFSADQAIPTIGISAIIKSNHLDIMFWLLLKRCFFMWNTKKIWETNGWKIPDWRPLKIIPLFIRGFYNKSKFLKPVYWLMLLPFDFFFLLSILFNNVMAFFKRNETSSDLNNTVIALVNKAIAPTPFSYLARKLYILRPLAGDESFRMLNSKELGVVTAFMWYFKNQLAPPMDKIAKLIITKEF